MSPCNAYGKNYELLHGGDAKKASSKCLKAWIFAGKPFAAGKLSYGIPQVPTQMQSKS